MFVSVMALKLSEADIHMALTSTIPRTPSFGLARITGLTVAAGFVWPLGGDADLGEVAIGVDGGGVVALDGGGAGGRGFGAD
jgi:hypothetical protein